MLDPLVYIRGTTTRGCSPSLQILTELNFMKNKILSSILFLSVLVILGAFSANSAQAQSSPFPAGCASALGYSATTGLPCNGTNNATIGPLQGCETALGYSAVNGVPCSGGSVAIFFLAGCSSLYGYSSITGQPCNGTAIATLEPITPFPGLPTTGAGGNALFNVLALLASGGVVAFGLKYLVRNREVS
jgi:hypothetical protein